MQCEVFERWDGVWCCVIAFRHGGVSFKRTVVGFENAGEARREAEKLQGQYRDGSLLDRCR